MTLGRVMNGSAAHLEIIDKTLAKDGADCALEVCNVDKTKSETNGHNRAKKRAF